MNNAGQNISPQPASKGGQISRILAGSLFSGLGGVLGLWALLLVIRGEPDGGIILFAFGLVFGTFGFIIWREVRRESISASRAIAIQNAHPGEPWLWKKAWAGGAIESSDKNAVVFTCVFAVVWNLAAFPMATVMLHDKLNRPPDQEWLVLLFPAAGIALVVLAIYMVKRWRKFGKSTFKMLPVPGFIGGQVAGAIQTSVKIKPQGGFHLKLLCIRRETQGSGKNQHTWDDILWEDEKILTRDLLSDDPGHSGIPVFFKVPPDAEPTDETNPRNKIIWQLTVQAKVQGISYSANFEIPVFNVPENAAALVPQEDPTLPFQPAAGPYCVPAGSRIQMNELANGGREFCFPMLQNLAPTVFCGFSFAFFLGITWLLATSGKAPNFLAPIFGLLDFGLLMLLLNFIFKSSRLVADASGLLVVKHRLFIWSHRKIAAADIAAINAIIGMTVGQVVYYDLHVLTRTDKDYTVVSSIQDKIEADRLADELRRLLKLDKPVPTPTIGA